MKQTGRTSKSTAMLKVNNGSKYLFLKLKEALKIDNSAEALKQICIGYIEMKTELKKN